MNCKGKIGTRICGGIVKKCTKCGNTGCTNYANTVKCTNLAVKNGGLCKVCGGTMKNA